MQATRSARGRVAFEAAQADLHPQETQYGRAKARPPAGSLLPPGRPGRPARNREIRRSLRPSAGRGRSRTETASRPRVCRPGLGRPTEADENTLDRFRTYQLLLLPLEDVACNRRRSIPRGTCSITAFRSSSWPGKNLPYDEEFLLAALLHDVGKAIDRRDHVAAGLEALRGAVSPRTAWLIEHHVEGLSLREGTLGVRLRRRLEAAEDFDELMLLADCDRRGRAVGRQTPDVRDALDYIRELAEACGDVGAGADGSSVILSDARMSS